MARYTLSDSLEEPEQIEKPPEYEKKKRYSIEEPSQLSRKGEQALKNVAKGAVTTGSVLYKFLAPSLNPKGFGQTLQEAAELAKKIEDKFGLTPQEAETVTERILEGGFKGAGGGGLVGGIPGAVAGFLGGAAGQGAREMGFPEPIATGVDIAIGFATPTNLLRKGTQKVASKTPELAKRAAVAEAENLPKVRGILKEPTKLIKPVATPEGMKSFDNKISNAIHEKSEQIMKESLLGKRLEQEGTYIGDLIKQSYDQAENLASKIDKKIDLTNLSKITKKSAIKIEQKAPSLAGATEEIVKKLKKYSKDFSPEVSPSSSQGSKLLDHFGNVIKKEAKIIPKKISANQFIDQWKEINTDLSSLYRKPELSGAEELYRKSLEEVKKNMLLEASVQLENPEFINSFRQANKIYNESIKFEKAKSLLDPVFEEGFKPIKFKQLFSSEKKFSDLSKALGKNNAHRLRDIQKYYVQPIEQMKKSFKVKSLLNLEDVVKGVIVKKILGIVGLPVTAALKITPYAKGKLLMSEHTQSLWVNLMRAIRDGSQRGVEKYSQALQEDLEE